MARVITIGKFPPLEGGIAAKTYWLAKALGETGHSIHIVTDRLEVDPLYSIQGSASMPTLRNVTLHRASQQDYPWTVPSIEPVALSLLNKGLEVVESHGADVIEGTYLVPYGLVAWMLSKITGLPFVVRHGGSDINKFVAAGQWPQLWLRMFSDARCVISDFENGACLRRFTERIQALPPYMPNPEAFSPEGRSSRARPVLALIGKANHHWQHKGWHRVIDIWSRMGEGFEFWIISQGRGAEKVQRYAEERIGSRFRWREFVAPWEMPDLLRSIDALFLFEMDMPFPVFSNLLLEALWSGTCVVTDVSSHLARYGGFGVPLESMIGSVLVVPPTNHDDAARSVERFVRRSQDREAAVLSPADYVQYVNANATVICSLSFT